MNELVLPMTVSALLVTGMGVALLGSIKLPLARRLEIDEARIGGLVSAFGFTIIPMILLSGFLTDHFGEQTVIVAGSLLMAAGLAVLARSRSYPLAVVAILVLGSAWSALVNAINTFVPTAFGGTMAYATNLSNVFFGLGAFFTPIGLSYVLRKRDMPPVLYTLSAAVLLPGALSLLIDFSSLVAPQASGLPPEAVADPGMGSLLADPLLWLCTFGMFFYSPLEAAMAAWSTTFLTGRGQKEETAMRWLSIFWLAFMSTRLVTAFTLETGAEAALVLILAVLCVVLMSGVVFSNSPGTAVATVVGAGLVFGPIFPTLLAILLDHFPLEIRGRAIGVFFAVGAVGWTVIPALIGAHARRTSLQRGFLFAVASAVGLTVVAIALVARLGIGG